MITLSYKILDYLEEQMKAKEEKKRLEAERNRLEDEKLEEKIRKDQEKMQREKELDDQLVSVPYHKMFSNKKISKT